MASKKKGGKGKKPAKKGRVRVPRNLASGKDMGMIYMGAHEMCSWTNPFCEEARGARFPDGACTRSLTWTMSGVANTYGTTAAGVTGNIITSNPWTSISGMTAFASPNATFNNALTALVTAPAAPSRYRVTSWGIKINCIQSKMNAAGTVRVRLYSPQALTSMGVVNVLDDRADAMIDIPMSRLIEKDLFVIPSAIGEQAREFNDYASAGSTLPTFVNNGWQQIVVFADGGPATTNVLTVYHYYNVEYIPTDGAAEYVYSQPAERPQPRLTEQAPTLTQRVGNFLTGAVDTVDKIFRNEAVQTVAGMALGAYTGGASGAAMGALTVRQRHRDQGRSNRAPALD
jgi:hypothetical protein